MKTQGDPSPPGGGALLCPPSAPCEVGPLAASTATPSSPRTSAPLSAPASSPRACALPRRRQNDGWTPLIIAANADKTDCVRFLIGAGVDLTPKCYGDTALDWAKARVFGRDITRI